MMPNIIWSAFVFNWRSFSRHSIENWIWYMNTKLSLSHKMLSAQKKEPNNILMLNFSIRHANKQAVRSLKVVAIRIFAVFFFLPVSFRVIIRGLFINGDKYDACVYQKSEHTAYHNCLDFHITRDTNWNLTVLTDFWTIKKTSEPQTSEERSKHHYVRHDSL